MSQNAEILSWLQSGKTLTKAECYAKGWGISINSRVAELNRTVDAKIRCWTESRNGKTVYVYGITSVGNIPCSAEQYARVRG